MRFINVLLTCLLTVYVASKAPRGGSKTQNGRFSSKSALYSKKVY